MSLGSVLRHQHQSTLLASFKLLWVLFQESTETGNVTGTEVQYECIGTCTKAASRRDAHVHSPTAQWGRSAWDECRWADMGVMGQRVRFCAARLWDHPAVRHLTEATPGCGPWLQTAARVSSARCSAQTAMREDSSSQTPLCPGYIVSCTGLFGPVLSGTVEVSEQLGPQSLPSVAVCFPRRHGSASSTEPSAAPAPVNFHIPPTSSIPHTSR